jgi:hypothetical protein
LSYALRNPLTRGASGQPEHQQVGRGGTGTIRAVASLGHGYEADEKGRGQRGRGYRLQGDRPACVGNISKVARADFWKIVRLH